MAVLETIRVKIGWLITILIAVALLSFIVDFNSLSSAINSTSSKYAVGEINGKKVPYKDFQEQVEYQQQIMEMVSGGTANSDESQQRVRQAAWQHFIDQNLFLKNVKAAGIEVGKDEMVDILSGDMISPVVAYDPIFGDPNGNFDKQRLTDYLGNLDSDASGNIRTYWNYLQNSAMVQQYYQKYGSLFSSSNLPGKIILKNIIDENNTSASADIVTVPFGYAIDTTITVSSSEIKSYYQSHKDQFKQVANRDIVYALFEVVPSEDDCAAANKAVEDVYEEFATTDNVKNFLMRNSEQSLQNYYYKAGELKSVNAQVDEFVFSGAKGVSPVIKDGDSYLAVKTVDTKVMPDSVFVRHILIQNNNSLADSLLNVLNAGKTPFDQLAALYSADQNENVAHRGDIGWMTQTYMIPGMESVMSAQTGKPFILDTQYGRHIVEVTKKTKGIEKKQIAILKKTAVPSKVTMNEYYNKANTLATQAAGNLESLRQAAKDQNVFLQDMNVTEATANYGAASRAKEVTRWIFDAKKGSASSVITVNQNFLFVVGVVDTHKEGYSTIAEASKRIQNSLYTQKKADKVLAEVKEKIASCSTIEEVSKALDITVESAENVSFAYSRNYEPAVIGAIAGAEIGKVAGPVKGNMGVYVVCVKDRNTASFFTEDDAKQQQSQKSQYTSQLIIPSMLLSSESVDHRERFY